MLAQKEAGLEIEPRKEDGLEPRIGRSLSIDRAAALLGVSRRTIYNRIRDGHLQTVRTLGGSQRILVDSLPRCDVSAFSVYPESSGARRRSL
jgi:excisionase family DNA binding protein